MFRTGGKIPARKQAMGREVERLQYRGTFIRVDLGAIARNAETLAASVAPARMMAVVKANAYGHGLVPVAQTAVAHGASWLGVALPEEGENLRASGIREEILVLGAVNEKGAAASVRFGLTQTVFDSQRVIWLERAAREQGRIARVHLKCDTGMGRIGVRDGHELKAVLSALADAPHVRLTGAFTHFADADGDWPDYTLSQIAAFERMRKMLPPGLLIHAAASAAGARYPQARYDMVREGILLYGCQPAAGCPKVEPALSWHTELVYVKEIPAGACVSYGCTYHADTPRRIATLPVGYGDGYHRALSGRAQVLIGGVRCPVVGRVCMDQLMVDVTALPETETRIGAPAVLLGRQGSQEITAEELAAWADTISYEMLLAATARVPILYQRQTAKPGA